MKVLVIGGNRFMGRSLVWRLLARGFEVTLLNRGHLSDPFGNRVERLTADRTTEAFDSAIKGRTFDATVDFAAFHGEDVRRLERSLGRGAGHYVLISTGQVYLVCPDAPRPSREGDFDRTVIPEPTRESPDWAEWEYGVGKRDCETAVVLAERQGTLQGTRLRLPIVNGEGDSSRRLESYLWRLLDGGPILLPRGVGGDCRHVYADDVTRAIVALLGRKETIGKAYNLSQDTSVPLKSLVEMLGAQMGSASVVVEMDPERLRSQGLEPRRISPFSQTWMSSLDPSKAQTELGFRPTAFSEYSRSLVTSFLAHLPSAPPENFRTRELELQLARTAR